MSDRAQGPVLAPPAPLQAAQSSWRLQRQCDCGAQAQGGECEACRTKRMQRKPFGAGQSVGVPASVGRVLGGSGRALDTGVRSFMESRFQRDFSQVRVHADGEANRSAREVQALAYTVGQHIVFGAGHYNPSSDKGRRLLAHELAHTVQQAGAPAVGQAKLEIDAANSPFEAAADRAADAVMAGGKVPALAPVGPTLSRQRDGEPVRDTQVTTGACRPDLVRPSVDPSDLGPFIMPPPSPLSVQRIESLGTDERRVTLTTGQRYRVRRERFTRDVVRGSARPRPQADADQEQVWVAMSWCEGSRDHGEVRFSANLPEQLIQSLVHAAGSEGGVDSAWQQASLTPRLSADFVIRGWRIGPSAEVTLESGGLSGAAGGLEGTVRTPIGDVTLGARVESQAHGDDPMGGLQVMGTARLQESSADQPPCVRHTTETGVRFSCVQENVPVPERTMPGTQPRTTAERHVHDLYFRFAVADFDEARSRAGVQGLTADLGAGFQVQSIEAWASPEGPMARRGRFMGNDELSRQRAEAARARVQTLCGPSATCISPSATVAGRGERLDPTDAQGRPQDVSGAPLERHVEQSFRTDPEEAPQRGDALMQDLHATPDQHDRAELIYPSLRRASVTVTRSQSGTAACTSTIPAHEGSSREDICPPGLAAIAFSDTSSGSGS